MVLKAKVQKLISNNFFQLRNIAEQHADAKKSRLNFVKRQWSQRGYELLRGKRVSLDIVNFAQSTDDSSSSTATKAFGSATRNWKSLQPDDSTKAS
jgi:hypothetical protein